MCECQGEFSRPQNHLTAHIDDLFTIHQMGSIRLGMSHIPDDPYSSEHLPMHCHVKDSDGNNYRIEIETAERMEKHGSFNERDYRLIRWWIEENKNLLKTMWITQRLYRI